MPGFAVLVIESGLGIVAAAEEEAGGSEEGFQRNDVPGVLGDDVGGEEVDFSWEIRDGTASGAAMGVEVVKTVGELGRALDLNAPKKRSWMGRTPGMRRASAEGWTGEFGFRCCHPVARLRAGTGCAATTGVARAL